MELAVAIFALTFAISLGLFGAIVVALPARYFAEEQSGVLKSQPPVVRWSAKIAKNLAGVALVALGVLLSLPGIPGQGILTIAIGVVLLDIPGKQRLVRAVVKRRGVLRNINRFRGWFGRSPLVLE